jgi:hypothetical protein
MVWLVASLGFAQEVPLTLRSVEALRVEAVPVESARFAGRGATATLVNPTGQFAWVTVELDLAWPADAREWKLDTPQIALEVGGSRVAPVGRVKEGVLDPNALRIHEFKPTTPVPQRWTGVFPIPSSASGSATLHLGSSAFPVTLPGTASPRPPLPVRAVAVSVTGVERVDHVDQPTTIGAFTGTTRVDGDLVAVDVVVRATAPNKDTGDGLFWATSYLSLAHDGGVATPLGEWFGNKVSDQVSHNTSVSSPPPSPARVYFVVPRGQGRNAKLRYLGEPVADVAVP